MRNGRTGDKSNSKDGILDDDQRASVEEELGVARGSTEDPFASAVRATRMPMVITDPRQDDNPIVFCNDAFTHLTGYDRTEILGRNCRFLQGPSTRREDVRKIGEAIAARRSVEVDILNYRKDGTTFWNALLVSPVFANGELAYFFASQVNVTERKRIEEHRFLLNRELDHRVKNTLATVQTVVTQTLRDADVPPRVAAAVSSRLRALSRSHDVLTQEAWSYAFIGDVVRGALEPLSERQGSRIAIEGAAIRIKPRIATMLSLAIHELGENALRYGSLSNEKGSVSIGWSMADDRFRLEWREVDGPPVTPPASTGYGIRVVERVLAAEFGGTALVEFLPAGVVFSLDAPAVGLDVDASEWSAP